MNNQDESRHMVDILFIIALFCVFAVSALMLVIIGADVYKKTVQSMDSNFSQRTSYSYITEKLRQNDTTGAVSITSFGDSDAICITETYNDTDYLTYLYLYEGSLCEINTRGDITTDPATGTIIIKMTDMSIEQITDGLYCATLNDGVESSTVYISTRSTN